MLDIIGEVLNQEPSVAAPVLRELTGPIVVHQQVVPGRKKPVWLARFGPNLVPLLARTAREHDYPSSLTWEYLSQRGWIMTNSAEVELDEPPRYMLYAAEAVRLIDQEGMCCADAARALGIGPMTAKHAYKFAKHGLKITQADPDRRSLADTFRRTQGPEAARRRDELDEPFHVIAEAMGVTRETARKATSATTGRSPSRPATPSDSRTWATTGRCR